MPAWRRYLAGNGLGAACRWQQRLLAVRSSSGTAILFLVTGNEVRSLLPASGDIYRVQSAVRGVIPTGRLAFLNRFLTVHFRRGGRTVEFPGPAFLRCVHCARL